MRFLMGVIVGIVLTIKAAFIADSLATEAAPGAEPRQSVGTLLGMNFMNLLSPYAPGGTN